MTNTIKVYIGQGSHLDGGPFEQVRIADYDDEHVITVDGHEIPRHHVAELAAEINRGQPGRISTVPKSEAIMSVRIECHDGVLFGCDGHIATGEELAQSGDLRRLMSRAFRNHAGEISENY